MNREDTTDDLMGPMHEALDRMRKAFETGKGVRLSWHEIEAMSRSVVGEWWREQNPLETPDNASGKPTQPEEILKPKPVTLRSLALRS